MTGELQGLPLTNAVREKAAKIDKQLAEIDPLFYHNVRIRLETGVLDRDFAGDMDFDEALGVLTAWTGRLFTRTLGHYAVFCRDTFGYFKAGSAAELMERFEQNIDMELMERAMMTVMTIAGKE